MYGEKGVDKFSCLHVFFWEGGGGGGGGLAITGPNLSHNLNLSRGYISDRKKFQPLDHVLGGHEISGRHSKPCKTIGETKQNDNHDAASRVA